MANHITAVQKNGDDRNESERRLLDSALTIFAAKGYDATTIREIIEKAGVTRPVLYYYFENKEELFCRLVETQFAEVREASDRILETCSSCRDRLKALIDIAFQRAERSPDMVRLLLQFIFSPPGFETRLNKDALVEERFGRVIEIMRQGLDNGELKGGEAFTLALAFSGIVDMHVLARSHLGNSHLSPELGEFLVDLFMEGANVVRKPQTPAQGTFSF